MMQSDATRAAFTLSLIHQRRDDRRITAIAVLKQGQRVFLGLDNGVIEEHRCLQSSTAGALPAAVAATAGGMRVLRLLAEKKVFSKQAIANMVLAEPAARLICMSAQGQVAFVSLETFAVVPLPAARGAEAIAVQHSQQLPVLAAVAVKAGKGRSKVLLFNMLPGTNTTGSHQPAVLIGQVSVPESVIGIAWAGSSVFLAVPGGYKAVTRQQSTAAPQTAVAATGQYQLTCIADHLASIQPMVSSVPGSGLGLMLWEENMVLVTDAAGAAVCEPLQLSMTPLALAAAGLFVVALCDDGVHVFDRTNSREVQHIDYSHDDAYVRLTQRLPAAGDAGGSCICLATSSQVLRLEPIAIEQQVRELLKRKQFDQALDLIHNTQQAAQASDLGDATAIAADAADAAGGRAQWHHIALAQAGLLLLLECEFERGLQLLQDLPPFVWQPCQLFSMFPDIMAGWLPRVPVRSYWGLHGQQLPPLAELVIDTLELRAATATTPRQQRWRQGQQSKLQLQQEHEQSVTYITASKQQMANYNSTASSPDSRQQQHGKSSSSRGSATSFRALPSSYDADPSVVEALVQQGKTAVAAYLSAVRVQPSMSMLDGIDTLLLSLLCDVGDAAAVELLVEGPNAAAAAAAAATLRAAGRWHALALLLMNNRQPQRALDTWKSLAAGELVESASTTGTVAEAKGDAAAVAVAAAAAAMAAGPHRVSTQVLLSGGGLQWLAESNAAACLLVLEARHDLDPHTVLQLLEGVGNADLRWQYLYHQVHRNSSSSAPLHTQLATVLLQAMAAHIPVRSSATVPAAAATPTADTPGDSVENSSSSSTGMLTLEQLAAMVHQLPISFAPNTAPTVQAAPVAGRAFSSEGAGLGLPPGPHVRDPSGGRHSRKPSTSLLATPHHSRHPSLGMTIPSASFLAASVADINRRSSRELPQLPSIGGIGSFQPLAASSNNVHQQQPPLQQQQQLCWPTDRAAQQQQQHSFGALAGTAIPLQTGAVARQQHQSPSWRPSSPGHEQQGPRHNRGPTRTLSSIAQLLQKQGSCALAKQSSGASTVTGLCSSSSNVSQQQQQHQHGQQVLRVLPAGLGPWPLQQWDVPDNSSSSSSGSNSQPAPAAQAATTSAAVSNQLQDSGAGSRPAAAAAAAEAAYDRVLSLRCLLVYHLQASLLYDAQAVLAGAVELPVYPEQALLLSRCGDHTSALALLALPPPRQVEGAISYARTLGSQEAWLALLEMFLNPQAAILNHHDSSKLQQGWEMLNLQAIAGRLAPDYGSACRVLNAEGASLNPLRLLGALPADLPLHLAAGVLGRMMSGLQHRRRQGQVVRNLQRCRQLASKAELVQLQGARVLLTDDTACHGCGRLIGGKVFYRYPSGVIMCSRCSGTLGGEAVVGRMQEAGSAGKVAGSAGTHGQPW